MNIQKNGMTKMNKLLNLERKYHKMYMGSKTPYFSSDLFKKLI